MTLSPRVAQSSPSRDTNTPKPVRKSRNSPFAAMNQTDARLRPEVRPKQSERHRPSSRKPIRGKGVKDTAQYRKTGEHHALKMQQSLSRISYGQRNRIKSDIVGTDSFDDFELLPVIKDSIATQGLNGLEDIAPTPIQRLAIPAILGTDKNRRSRRPAKDTEQFLLAAETGSGKTMAYLLPVIDAVKRIEAEEKVTEVDQQQREEAEKKLKGTVFDLEAPPLSDAQNPKIGRPRAIILLPTAELVQQVGKLVKSFSHTVKYRSSMVSSSDSAIVIRNRIFKPDGIDILVSTPHLLSSIAEGSPQVLSKVSHMVIDEADSLFDRSFAPITSTIVDKATPTLKQLILCSATIPRSLDSYLRKRFPDIRRLTTPNLHAVPRRVQLGVVETSRDPYRGNKDLACADTIWSIGRTAQEHGDTGSENEKIKRIIVFVNEREKTQELAEFLGSKGIDAVALHRDTTEQRKNEILDDFTLRDGASATAEKTMQQPKNPSGRRQLPNVKVLVMTDIGSRGIDTLAVRHVILYDVPHTTIDFIHRLGRVGRMGRRGRGIVLVGSKDRRDVVKEVRESMYLGKALI
jgi:ATP-dependent RNA helicase MRH4, mitochondrial